jgi:hypothetical protein
MSYLFTEKRTKTRCSRIVTNAMSTTLRSSLLPACLKKQSTGVPTLRKDKGMSNECLYLAISGPNCRDWMFGCMYFVSVSACILGLVGPWVSTLRSVSHLRSTRKITVNCEDSSHIRLQILLLIRS